MLYDLSPDYRCLRGNRLAGVSRQPLVGVVIQDFQLDLINQTSTLIQKY
jgi:hypothetical protein